MNSVDDLLVIKPRIGAFSFLPSKRHASLDKTGSRIPSQIVFKSTMNALFNSKQGRGEGSALIGRHFLHEHLGTNHASVRQFKIVSIKQDSRAFGRVIDKSPKPHLTGVLTKSDERSLKVSDVTREEVDQHREECSARLKKVGLHQQVRLTKAARRLQGREMESGIQMYQAILDFLAPQDDPPRIVLWEDLEREAAKGE